MENEKMPDELRRALCSFIEKDLRSDPNCPPAALACIDMAKTVRKLQDTALELVELAHSLLDAEDVGRIREIEQYAKLVTAGIKQYVAAVREERS